MFPLPLPVPLHMFRGHVLFLVTPGEEGNKQQATTPILFSGDTLFVGGCGRFFEGNAAESKSQHSDMLKGPTAELYRLTSCASPPSSTTTNH